MDQNKEIEKWIPIKGFEGLYECSSLARIRSLDTIRNCRWGNGRLVKGKIFSPTLSGELGSQYYAVTLTNKFGKTKTIKVHNIIFFSFNHEIEKIYGYQVDHKDDDKLNNRPENLQYITCRDNSLKRSARKKTNCLPGCVRNNGSFMARICYKGKYYYLGTFTDEMVAHEKYIISKFYISNGLSPFGLQPIVAPLTHINARATTIAALGS